MIGSYIKISQFFDNFLLKVGTKFVNPWSKKVMIFQLSVHRFFSFLENIFQHKSRAQISLAHQPKKPCLVSSYFFTFTIHCDPTCYNEENEEKERKNPKIVVKEVT
jgi:hypothetical protein